MSSHTVFHNPVSHRQLIWCVQPSDMKKKLQIYGRNKIVMKKY